MTAQLHLVLAETIESQFGIPLDYVWVETQGYLLVMVELIWFYLGSAINRTVFLLLSDAVVLVPVLNGHF